VQGATDNWRQFQEDSKDASVSECTWTLSALKALRKVVYYAYQVSINVGLVNNNNISF